LEVYLAKYGLKLSVMVTDYLEKFSIGMPTNVNWWDLPNRIVDS